MSSTSVRTRFLASWETGERVDVKTLLKGNVKDTNTDVNGNKYRFIKATATDNLKAAIKSSACSGRQQALLL